MDADLVVLDGDPAEDIVAFSKVWLTMRNGIVIFAVNPNLPTVHDL
jgi:imidazolonepropionase-like amidohydrolase